MIAVHRTRIDWVAYDRKGELFFVTGHVSGIRLDRAAARPTGRRLPVVAAGPAVAHRLAALAGRAGLLLVTPLVALSRRRRARRGQPPVCQPDAVTVTIDSREAHLRPRGQRRRPRGRPDLVRRHRRQHPRRRHHRQHQDGWPPGRRGVRVDLPPARRHLRRSMPGTYQVKTFMNDGRAPRPSTLTITVLPSPRRRRRADQEAAIPARSWSATTTPSPCAFYWGAEGRRRADGVVDIPAHATRTIEVLRKSLVIAIVAGSEFAIDIRRHFKMPRDGTALAPGVEHGHGPPRVGHQVAAHGPSSQSHGRSFEAGSTRGSSRPSAL